MIKLIAIDLDGTLLTKDRMISDENKQAIKEAKEQGIKVVLCTGRPLLGMVAYLEELNLRESGDYGITYNGGLVQKTDSGEVLSQKTLSKKEVLELYKLSQDINVPCNFIDLERVYEPPYPIGRESLYPKVMNALPFVPVLPEDFPEDVAVNKVVFCYEEGILDEAIVCELLGIESHEVMAIGDEANDFAMIEFAGMGVAMENATPEIKEVAQFITKHHDDHGVAHAIRKFALK